MSQLEAAQSTSFRDLKESESRFEQLFQASPFPATVTRFSDGKVLAANESAAQRFGASIRAGFDLFAVDFHVDPSQRDIVTKRFKTEGHFEDQLLHLKNLKGETFWAIGILLAALLTMAIPPRSACFMTLPVRWWRNRHYDPVNNALAAQSEALTGLMERQARSIPFEDHLRDILETCARTIGVARLQRLAVLRGSKCHYVCGTCTKKPVTNTLPGSVCRGAAIRLIFAPSKPNGLSRGCGAHGPVQPGIYGLLPEAPQHLLDAGHPAAPERNRRRRIVSRTHRAYENVAGRRQSFALAIANLIVVAPPIVTGETRHNALSKASTGHGWLSILHTMRSSA
jgi:PAS domain-containing protein